MVWQQFNRAGDVNDHRKSMERSIKSFLAAILAILFPVTNAVAQGKSHTSAEFDTHPMKEWGLSVFESCAPSGLEFGNCLSDLLANTVLEQAAAYTNRQGQSVFGQNFQLSSRMSLDSSSGLTGNLDAVIPLGFNGTLADEEDNAFFLQNGITSWRDSDGSHRNDIRYGVVYRFPVFKASVLGVSVLNQESLERGHQRTTMGMDYAGRWGTGYVQHFVPTTGWRPGRSGYEERARGGTELGARLELTSTLSADVALGRWETSNDHDRNTWLGLNWRPHPWLTFAGGYETTRSSGSGSSGEDSRISVVFRMPFGDSGQPRPRWRGLGVAVGGDSSPDLWSPITSVGSITTLEQAASTDAGGSPDGISVQFLQDDATTGSRIGVRVSVPQPLSEDLRLVVRLVPGSGANPAVPGEDFVDVSREVTIRQNEASADTWFQLLYNGDMQTARSLAVEVSNAG